MTSRSRIPHTRNFLTSQQLSTTAMVSNSTFKIVCWRWMPLSISSASAGEAIWANLYWYVLVLILQLFETHPSNNIILLVQHTQDPTFQQLCVSLVPILHHQLVGYSEGVVQGQSHCCKAHVVRQLHPWSWRQQLLTSQGSHVVIWFSFPCVLAEFNIHLSDHIIGDRLSSILFRIPWVWECLQLKRGEVRGFLAGLEGFEILPSHLVVLEEMEFCCSG